MSDVAWESTSLRSLVPLLPPFALGEFALFHFQICGGSNSLGISMAEVLRAVVFTFEFIFAQLLETKLNKYLFIHGAPFPVRGLEAFVSNSSSAR